jgi:hypothetical protein
VSRASPTVGVFSGWDLGGQGDGGRRLSLLLLGRPEGPEPRLEQRERGLEHGEGEGEWGWKAFYFIFRTSRTLNLDFRSFLRFLED